MTKHHLFQAENIEKVPPYSDTESNSSLEEIIAVSYGTKFYNAPPTNKKEETFVHFCFVAA